VIPTNAQFFAAFRAAEGFRPFQENKPPKNEWFFEKKASGLGGFKSWNYLIQRNSKDP
jgi:hypothetical protein